MDSYNVEFTKNADRDLRGIFAYIKTQSSSKRVARRFVDALRTEIINCLSFWPQGYRLADNDLLAAKGLHKLIVKGYLAFFTVNETKNTANVKRIIHGKRDWITILRGNDEAESTDKQF